MAKVTLITDTDEAHTVKSPYIRLDKGIHSHTVVFEKGEVLPDAMRGVTFGTITQWEIVVTDNELTTAGPITNASPMRLRFKAQN